MQASRREQIFSSVSVRRMEVILGSRDIFRRRKIDIHRRLGSAREGEQRGSSRTP